MMTPRDMANDPFFTGAETLMNDTRMFKKGGRVKGCGIAKRGVGRAMKKIWVKVVKCPFIMAVKN